MESINENIIFFCCTLFRLSQCGTIVYVKLKAYCHNFNIITEPEHDDDIIPVISFHDITFKLLILILNIPFT